MPKFYKQNLLTSPLDDPELPSGEHEHMPLDWEDDDFTKILLTWKAPERPFRKKDRSYYTYIIILLFVLSLLSILFIGSYLLVGVLISLGFMIYVLGLIPPDEVEYKLSAQGVTIGNHFYHWEELDSFWFSEKEGSKILNIVTQLRFPTALFLILGDTDQEQVKKICARFLPYHEIAPKSMIDKWSEYLQKHFPLENPHT